METITGAMDEGFAFVAMARALLREPDLVNKLKTKASSEGICRGAADGLVRWATCSQARSAARNPPPGKATPPTFVTLE